MGLPSIGTFDDRKPKPGGKEPRNKNPAVTSLNHLAKKDTTLHGSLMDKLDKAMETLADSNHYGDLVNKYKQALGFD